MRKSPQQNLHKKGDLPFGKHSQESSRQQINAPLKMSNIFVIFVLYTNALFFSGENNVS